jgi:hypothetical protein
VGCVVGRGKGREGQMDGGGGVCGSSKQWVACAESGSSDKVAAVASRRPVGGDGQVTGAHQRALEQQQQQKTYSTEPSRVVPHRSTTSA